MLGAQELVIFDPMAREGKSPANPAYAMQVYRGGEKRGIRRVYAGEGPVYSEVMAVWLHPEERGLLVTRDGAGKEPVATREEAEGWWRELRKAREEQRKAEESAAEAQRRAAEERERSAEEQRRLAEAQAMADAREALVDLCDALAIDLTPERQAHLASLDLPALRSLRTRLKQARRWPD
jgi:hypothetical protein